jgi:hypothetical protein
MLHHTCIGDPDRHAVAESEQVQAVTGPGSREGAVEQVAALAGVRPAREVQRHHVAGAE